MKFRDILIIILALVVSIALALGTRYLLQDQSGEGGSAGMTKVLVATGDLPIGSRLEQKSFRWQEWPRNSVQTFYITTETKNQADKLVGALVRDSIGQGEPIIVKNLVLEKGGVLSAVVDQGMRAFTIPVDRRSSISGQVLPNDLVDVIVATKDSKSRSYVARTVVRKVRVLEINSTLDPNEAEDTTGDKAKIRSITVQVQPNQAEALAAAMREGNLVISLHSLASRASQLPDYEDSRKTTDDVITLFRANEVQKIKIKS